MPWPSPAQNVQALHNPLALIDFDFVNGVYLESGVSSSLAAAPGWAFSRTTTGYGQSVAGVLTSFAIDAPRITNKGLLIEAAATNLMPRSQTFDHADWTKTNATITADTAAAPDGTMTADRLTDDAVNGVHRVFGVGAVVAASTYTMSTYVEPATLIQANMIESAAGGGLFNLTGAGSVQAGTGSIQAVGNFYRIISTKVAGSAFWVLQLRSAVLNNDVYSGVGSTFNLWGAQLELGSTASSYIPTGASAVTRGADVASIAFTGGRQATVVYGGGLIATVAVTTSLDLGASSGGPWVGSYVERVVVR